MRFWPKRKKHQVEPEDKAYIPLSQIGDDTLAAMKGRVIISMATPDESVKARMEKLSMHYGPIAINPGSDGLWKAMAASSHKIYSGSTKHQALDALERDLR